MKKKYFIAVLAVNILLFTSIQSCMHESLETEIVNVQSDPVSYIKSEYMRGKDMVVGKQVEWEKARKYDDGKNIILITVPIKNQGSKIIEELTFRIDNNKVSGHLWKFESERGFNSSDYSLSAHQIMEKMTGTASYIALEGSMRYKIQLVDGKFIEEIAYRDHGGILPGRCKPCHGEIDEIVITVPGGGGTGGGIDPTTNPSTPIPGGVGGPTNPQNPDNPPKNEEPCKKIKQQKNDPNYKAKTDYLKSKTGASSESGFRVGSPVPGSGQTETQYQELSNSPGTSQLDFKIFNNTFGVMHSHYDGLIPIFSPGDINNFIQLLLNAKANNIPLDNVFLTVVTSSGTYQLRGDGINADNLSLYTDTQIDALNLEYIKKIGDSNISTENLQKGFLEFMKRNMNITDAKLFDLSDEGKSKELKTNGNNLDKVDCP
ncbi:hypothetical protein MP478_12550 [Chryseobacterium sp. WG14]|uniref:hypothetical protein n=1 Tax=Chryseobacterium sp. WG14 TaxID=2926909 RepID=UPI00211E7420|nr:hypothetical protein [Chryseobacterium sp. WG14]MCQ9640210.1 hypothetical protein [Chryseobacterium sp. WG14]